MNVFGFCIVKSCGFHVFQNIYKKRNVNKHHKVLIKDDLLWGLLNKKLVYINEGTENITEVTSGIQNINFISSTLYKVGKKFDIKQNNLT